MGKTCFVMQSLYFNVTVMTITLFFKTYVYALRTFNFNHLITTKEVDLFPLN